MLKEKQDLKKFLVNFLREEGVDIRTNTKARGHLGIFREGRIDINKKVDEEEFAEIALHEYAHFIHKKIEPEMHKTGGCLQKLFCLENTAEIQVELGEVTKIIDDVSSSFVGVFTIIHVPPFLYSTYSTLLPFGGIIFILPSYYIK